MGDQRLKVKYCLVGGESVGKTCFARQLDSKPFDEEYNPTIGVELLIYLSSFEGIEIKYQIWDSSGKENNSNLVNEYCKTSSGILAFYDISSENSFVNLKTKIETIKSLLDSNPSVIIIGNKTDLEDQRAVSKEDAELFAKENNFLFTEISLKYSTNAAQETIKKITENVMRKIDLLNGDNFTSRSFLLPRLVNESASMMNTARSQRIDAMSNSVLVSSTNIVNRLSEIENRKFIADLIDQMKMLKADNEKKDRLIGRLSSLREPKTERHEENYEFERFLNIERNAFDTVKKDLETKYETVSFQLSEEKAKVSVKEEKIIEQKNEIDLLKIKIEDLRKEGDEKSAKLSQFENDLVSYENVRNKSTITINVLQNDNKELQSKILELESKNREILMEKEELEAKLKNSNDHINLILRTVELSESENFESITEKLKAMRTESLISKGKNEEFNQQYTFIETENNLNKKFISDLKNQIRTLESQILEYKVSTDNLRAEKDAAISSKEIIEQKMEELKEKTNNTQQVWLSVSKKLDLEEQKCSENEHKLKDLEKMLSEQQVEFKAFIEEVASLLSDDYFQVESNKHEIKEKIKLLMLSSKHRGLMIGSLEGKIKILSHDIKAEAEQKMGIKFHLDSNKTVLKALEDKIFDLESKLNEKEMKIESLLVEREKIVKVVESLANSFEIPPENIINSIPSLDKCIDIILYKINTKKTTPEPINVEKFSHEEKINSLREQLNNKDIHLELLRKKLADLEEEKFGRSDIRTEYDKMVTNGKKLKIKIERLNEELANCKSENSHLKSHLMDINNLKFQITTKDTEIDKQKLKIAELESACDSYMIRIGNLKEDIDSTTSHLDQTKSSSDNSIKALSDELRSVRIEYNKTKTREHQLLDFRNVVAKKVGLEMNSLSVPDYEIIARIEYFVNDRIHLISHHPPFINNIQF